MASTALVFLGMAIGPAFATNYVVGNETELRSALASQANGDTITLTSDITLTTGGGGNLPDVHSNITISGGGHTLSGGGDYRGLFVTSGTVRVQDLKITNALAEGGSSYSGGSGAGLGGALFVNEGAIVTISNVDLSGNQAKGGSPAGTFTSIGGPGNGGAGMLGDAVAGPINQGGTGGGPNGGAGGVQQGTVLITTTDSTGGQGNDGAVGSAGGTGGGGGGGGGGQGVRVIAPSGDATAYGGDGGAGGAGGFGGGGGQGGSASLLLAEAHDPDIASGIGGDGGAGGAGGFGGGGGTGGRSTSLTSTQVQASSSVSSTSDSGNGGSGGRAGFGASGGLGGAGATNGATLGDGTGAGMGGALFVREGGTLIVEGDLGLGGNTVEAGGAGSQAFGSGMFLQGGGTLNLSPGSGSVQVINDVIADMKGVVDAGYVPPAGTYDATHDFWSLNKTGAGKIILAGANQYSGGTDIRGGTLEVANNQALGSGAVNLHGTGTALLFDYSQTSLNPIFIGVLDSQSDSTLGAGNGATVTATGGNFAGGSVHFGTTGYGGIFTLADGAGFAVKPGIQVAIDNGTYRAAGTQAAGLTEYTGSALTVAAPGTYDLNGRANKTNNLLGGGTILNDVNTAATLAVRAGDFGGTIRDGAGTTALTVGLLAVDGFHDQTAGQLILTGTNTYTGGTTISAGILQLGNGGATGSIAGDVTDNAMLAFNRSDTYSFDGKIAGSGGVGQLGAGKTILTATNLYSGATTVTAGELAVSGSAANSAFTVKSGGVLSGGGTVGGVTAEAGSAIAAGNGAIGTLRVTGDYIQQADATYRAEIGAGETSDLIHASGTADIDGALLDVSDIGASLAFGQRYTILHSDGALTGQFDFDAISLSAFIGLVDGYDANNAWLDVAKVADFADAGLTPNQIATGGGLDTIPTSGALFTAVASLATDAEARAAFDQLSGEIHASAKGMLVEDSRFVRDAATNRIASAFGDGTTAALPVMAYGEGGPEMVAADTDRFAVWGQAFGSWGNADSDGNAAAFDHSTGGLLAGADTLVGGWRVGLIGGYSHSNFDADDRNSSGKSDSYHLGLYGGTNWGAIAFRTGAAYSWSSLSTKRSVAFNGFTDGLSADYDAGTAQVFGELAYKAVAGQFKFEPFANLAYVSVHTDGFTETGGPAALTSAGSTTDATFTTLGLRGSTEFALGGINATARGMLGWRHAFGDVTPKSSFAFAGGDAFTIAGVPIAGDSAVIEAGLDLNLAPNAKLGLSYSGQFGSGATDNGAKVDLSVKF